MKTIVQSNMRFRNKEGWLDTRWHFSFSDYYDPKNNGWGSLRVFNDDRIAPGGIFDMHPHANFEIFTLVLEGELGHRDSQGNNGAIKEDEAQIMSAGSGIFHSEANSGKSFLHLLQIWLSPAKKGGKAEWKTHAFKKQEFANALLPLVSGEGKIKSPLRMRQSATIYRSILAKGKSLSHPFSQTHGYIFVISGSIIAGGDKMEAGDSMKIKDEKKIEIKSDKGADFLLFDMP